MNVRSHKDAWSIFAIAKIFEIENDCHQCFKKILFKTGNFQTAMTLIFFRFLHTCVSKQFA